MAKGINTKITVRVINGDTDNMAFWKNAIAQHGDILSESPLMNDNKNFGFSVKHFEVSSFSGGDEE
ncbi:hypothetical protein [Anaerorhabdus sp.]|uniref:hypothetical protein n=1 Tax=Anaerorhabdus sp. TaxID=1872524 RepID=UPI002FC5A650